MIQAVQKEENLLTLKHAHDQEMAKGKRGIVIAEIAKRGESLRTQGPGSESPDDPFSESKLLDWEPVDATKMEIKEHDFGEGSESKQNLSDEQRILGQIKIKANEHRIRDIGQLTTPIDTLPNKTKVFCWGNIIPQQKEVKDEKGHVLVSHKPHTFYLKTCPNCGKINKPDSGIYGECVHCKFSIIERVIRPFKDNFLKHIPDLEIPVKE